MFLLIKLTLNDYETVCYKSPCSSISDFIFASSTFTYQFLFHRVQEKSKYSDIHRPVDDFLHISDKMLYQTFPD